MRDDVLEITLWKFRSPFLGFCREKLTVRFIDEERKRKRRKATYFQMPRERTPLVCASAFHLRRKHETSEVNRILSAATVHSVRSCVTHKIRVFRCAAAECIALHSPWLSNVASLTTMREPARNSGKSSVNPG